MVKVNDVKGWFVFAKITLFLAVFVIVLPVIAVIGGSGMVLGCVTRVIEMAHELVDLGCITEGEFKKFERSIFK